MTSSLSDGVTYEPSGDVRVVARGKVYRLRNPTFGTFGLIRSRLTDNLNTLKEETGKSIEELRKGEGLLDDPKAMERAQELSAEVMAYAFELCDAPLPDRGQWPVWLHEDQTLLSMILLHWRTTPLGSG